MLVFGIARAYIHIVNETNGVHQMTNGNIVLVLEALINELGLSPDTDKRARTHTLLVAAQETLRGFDIRYEIKRS